MGIVQNTLILQELSINYNWMLTLRPRQMALLLGQ